MISKAVTGSKETQFAVDKQPKDSVSDMKFISAGGKLLLGATSWDGSVRVYHVEQDFKSKTIMEHIEQKTAFLRFCFNPDGNSCYVATSNNEILQFDIKDKPTKTVIGTHDDRIIGIGWLENKKCVIACSVDKVIQLWDPTTKKSVSTIRIPTSKPTYMSCSGTYAIYSDIGIGKLHLIDFKDASQKPININIPNIDKCGLITGISVEKSNSGFNYITGSTYGFNVIGNQNESQLLAGHYKKSTNTVFASNSVSMCGSIGISGGSDGKIVLYDYTTGKKINDGIDVSSNKGTPVTAVALSPVGNFAAIALGNDWSSGREGKASDPSIFIKKLDTIK